MELTARMRAILSALLAADGYVPAERIASALDVSARTITREMHGLEMALMPYGITLLRRTGAGFMLTGDKADLTRLRTQISKVNVRGELTPDQRRSILVTRLLMADEPIKLFALARILDVTDSTVSHDLDRLQPFLAEQGITLVRRPGLGVYVEGAERDIRSALVRIIHDCMDEKELLALVADDGVEGAASAADRALLGLVDGAQIRTIDDIVAEETQGRDIPDTARVGLVVHLALAVRRMQQHDAIVMDAGTLGELRRTEEFAAARMIAAQLGKVFSLSVPEAEIGYITMHLLGARGTALPAGAGRVDNFRLVQIAQSIMRLASEKSGAPLIRSRTLLSGLVNHLAPALHRLKLHMDIRNPLLAEVEAEHPELMELARYSTRMMEEEVGAPLPADEIAYIAIHIGAALTEAGGDHPVVRVLVACPTGLGTSRLLASRIRRAYERIRVVGELSSLALTAQEITRRAVDFVVSTVPLPPLPVPVVVASAFLTASDRARIDAVLASCVPQFAIETQEKPQFSEAMAEIHCLSGAIYELLKGFRLRVDIRVQTLPQLADAAAQLLVSEGAADIAAALLRREEIAPTWVAPQMILLHTEAAALRMPLFGVLRLAQPLPYGADAVRTALVMLAPTETAAAKQLLGTISAQTAERPSFKDILAYGDADEIRRALEYVFEEHFHERLEELL
ncbi:BglG family transcription antiterminator [Selenomonas sp. oral taxon 138]|uniref:BglG family transcription antiterminator n=1 Tax=Selenomonas sp. oral taxon 138 TaxID=712532 RepID=UPI0002A4338B|nr:PRD domain-containing protein [Selenomonas sp. oral taxon 138]EKY01654.1 PRD domain protein [Selenomonas sp. oral taxon 138 str. F0429]